MKSAGSVLGGLLVAVPKTRSLGLLVLGPIFVNILAFHLFVMDGVGLFDPMIVAIAVLMGGLLFTERKAFLGLVQRARGASAEV